LIVDFGSQVTQLITRGVREEGVYSEIVPYQKAEAAFARLRPKAVILSGGPASVLDPSRRLRMWNRVISNTVYTAVPIDSPIQTPTAPRPNAKPSRHDDAKPTSQ
jgi:GMP synthase-like glutamine amidotransferase